MASLWDYYHDFNSWDTLAQERKDEIVKYMKTKEAARHYNYATCFSSLVKYLPANDAFEVFKEYMSHDSDGNRYMHDEGMFAPMKDLYEKIPEVRELVLNSTSPKIHRALFALGPMNKDEEVKALRALGTVKYPPSQVYACKFTPTTEALNELPPVMRLNALECLLSNNYLGYNMFAKVKNVDEFKSLLFGAVLRHRERVEAVWEKFQEVRHIGREATINIDYVCENCGPYNITMTSAVVRTKTGLENTRVASYFLRENCMLCGSWSGVTTSATFPEEDTSEERIR